MTSNIINITSDNFEQEVIKSQLPVIVYFYSDDCAPCMALSPMFDRMAERYGEAIKFVKVFRLQNRDLAEKYNVKSSPTLLFFREGKEACLRLTGYICKPELRKAIETVIGGECNETKREKVRCDVLIIGGGPAGLSAAIYAARSKLYTIIVEEGLTGGQVATTYHVANYPGTNGVVRGNDLVDNMKKQAESFGTIIDDLKEISEVIFDGKEKCVKTEDTDYYAKSIIIATGASPRKLPAEGEREFRGRGVHYCATCDGAMYQDANIIVVGGGTSAVEEAVFLTRYAKHITIISRGKSFKAAQASQNEVFSNPNISVIWDTEIRKVNGDNFVTNVTVENLVTKETSTIETEGIFVYIGSEPKSSLFQGKLDLDDYGYIVTDEDMMTSVRGVYAAGDIRKKKIKQISTAVGDGTVAGVMAERFLSEKGEKDITKDLEDEC